MKTLAVQLAEFFPFPFDSSGNLFFSIFLRQQRINPWYTTSARKRLNAGCKSPRHQRVSTSYVQATEKIGASGYDCHTDDSGVWSTARTRWCCDVWQPKGCKTDGFCKYDLALWHEDVFIFNFMIFHKWFMILGFDSNLS